MHSDDVFVFKLFKFIRRNFYSIDFGDAIFRNALLFQDLQPQSTERERERERPLMEHDSLFERAGTLGVALSSVSKAWNTLNSKVHRTEFRPQRDSE